ncbi:hypothetical protein PZA11_007545 [Diplocarpon coronariae]
MKVDSTLFSSFQGSRVLCPAQQTPHLPSFTKPCWLHSARQTHPFTTLIFSRKMTGIFLYIGLMRGSQFANIWTCHLLKTLASIKLQLAIAPLQNFLACWMPPKKMARLYLTIMTLAMAGNIL